MTFQTVSKINILLWLAVYALCIPTAWAQEQNEDSEALNHEKYLSLGAMLRTGNVNLRSLESGTSDGQTSQIGNINLGLSAYLNKFIGELNVSFSPFATDFGYSTETSKFLGLQANFGYTVWEENILRAFPLVGFGIQRFASESQDNWSSRVFYNLGLGGDIKIPNSILMLGIRGGYSHNVLTPSALGLSTERYENGGAFMELRCAFRLP
jgi:hypothetical protein